MRQRILTMLCTAILLLSLGDTAWATSNPNGVAGQMPSYYDDQLFTINFMELGSNAEAAQLQHNGSINVIYMCDTCEEAGLMFVSVLDAIQGDGFNPLWQEVQIEFTAGHAPRQLTSDTEVLGRGGGRDYLGADDRGLPLLSSWAKAIKQTRESIRQSRDSLGSVKE